MTTATKTKSQGQYRYQSTVDAICRLLRQRGLRPGDRLPTEHELARQLGVSYVTVRRANDILAKDGLIVREHGRGTFVAKPRTGPNNVTVGLLGVNRELDGYTLSLYRHLSARLSEALPDSHLLFECVRSRDGVPVVSQQLRNAVDAVILSGDIDEHAIANLMHLPVPMLVGGFGARAKGVPAIQIDHAQMAYETVRALTQVCGYEQVWLVSGSRNSGVASTPDIISGYRKAADEGLIPCDLIAHIDRGEDNAGRSEDLDAFVRTFNHLAPKLGGRQAILWWCSSRVPYPHDRLKVDFDPNELGLVGFMENETLWQVPAEHDLGLVRFPWGEYEQALIDAIGELITQRYTRDVVLRPSVSAKRNEHGRLTMHTEWTRTYEDD